MHVPHCDSFLYSITQWYNNSRVIQHTSHSRVRVRPATPTYGRTVRTDARAREYTVMRMRIANLSGAAGGTQLIDLG